MAARELLNKRRYMALIYRLFSWLMSVICPPGNADCCCIGACFK
jgi:hypothetical protein